MAPARATKVGGRLERLRLSQLEPDRLNPRLPQHIQAEELSEDALYEYMASAYDAVTIAESIARHGYFESEPLIAVPARVAYPGETRRGAAAKRYVVVEGNRRLTALKALADPGFRARLTGRRWADIPHQVSLPSDLPVLVVGDRQQVAPILGFRHITGIAAWEPYPQANYIADLVDNQGRSFADVADLLRRSETEVRSFYRNFWIGEQARDSFQIPDADRIVDSFGVFTRAMQNPNLRAYIEAPDPAEVTSSYYPLPDTKKTALSQLMTWLFGKPRKAGDRDTTRPRPGQVIGDSREVTRFGTVLAAARGRAAIKKGKSLEEAEEALRDPVEQVRRSLRAAVVAIEITIHEHRPGTQQKLKQLLRLLNDALRTLERDADIGS